MIDVIIPVGPYENDKKWLPECLHSLRDQSVQPAHVWIMDDQAHLEHGEVNPYLSGKIPYSIWRSPWRLGCADMWNIGVALSHNYLALLMGADDWLQPDCIESCLSAWRIHQDAHGYYHLVVKYSTGELQNLPCNAAMVTQDLWKHTGGFGPEAGVGAPDALLISILLGNGDKAGNLRQVPVQAGSQYHYNVRVHEGQDTRRTGKYHQQIIDVRNIATASWAPATWTK